MSPTQAIVALWRSRSGAVVTAVLVVVAGAVGVAVTPVGELRTPESAPVVGGEPSRPDARVAAAQMPIPATATSSTAPVTRRLRT